MPFCSCFHGYRDWLISNRWIWGLIGFLCGAGVSSAQQTSYSVQLQPGYNSIANHLVHGGNRLNEIIPNPPANSELHKFNPTTQSYYGPAIFSPGFGWFSQDPAMEYLNPGEGAFLFVNQATVLTFSGSNAQLTLPRQVLFGRTNFVSGHEPRTMTFPEVFGFPPANGDIVYFYDQPFTGNRDQIQQNASSTHKFTTRQGWDNAPSFKRGRSAFVFLSPGPRIMQHPTSQTFSAGQTLRLDVSLLGISPFSYQWQFNDDDLAGQTNSTLVLGNIQYLQTGLYSVTVKNSFSDVTSKPASIRVSSPPVILDPPLPVRTIPGQMVQLRVRAVGTPTLQYRWFRNNVALQNATGPVLEESVNATAQYHVKVMNTLGSTESDPVVVEVNEPVSILEHPRSIMVPERETATFSVVATGAPPLRYQWRRNGENLKDETNSTLVIHDAHPTNSGVYQVTVGNVMGAVDSKPAELKVHVPFDIVLKDRIEDSILYEMLAFTGRGHNLGATNEKDEVHCKRVGGSSVWLAWRTKVRGIMRFETSGSTFDTVIAAYTTNRFGERIEVVCDDDEGEFYGSRIEFAATPDVTYFIAIDGLDGAQGQILLDWELKPTLETLPVILEQPRDQTVPFDGRATFSVLATGNPNLYIWYRDGIQVAVQTQPQFEVPRVRREDLGTYHVEIYQDNRFVISRRVLLQVSLADMDTRLLDAFAVDKFADALDRRSTGSLHSVSGTAFTPALGYTGTQIFSTIGFRGEPGELSHCGIPGGSSAWFSFIPAADGQLHLNTAGSSYDTVLAVYTGPGPTIASLTALVCDNDSGPGTTSSLNFPANEGTTYYIAVDGYNGVTGSAQLNYRLLVPMTLTDMTKTNDIVCSLFVTATPSYPFTIQRCSGFQVWTPVLTTNSPVGEYNYRDTNATPIRRFYRAIQTP